MNFLEGQKLIKQKEYGKALNIFLNLQKNGIKNKNIYFYLGLIYSELNDFNKSILNYTKYLKTDPDSKSALFNLAIAKQSIGEIDSAKDIYLKLITLERNNIRPYFALLMKLGCTVYLSGKLGIESNGVDQGNRTLYLIPCNYYRSLKILFFNSYFKSNDDKIIYIVIVE